MGKYREPGEYELRIDGRVIETSTDNVDLYWKARRAVNGKPGVVAEVESLPGCFYVHFGCTDATLRDWERA